MKYEIFIEDDSGELYDEKTCDAPSEAANPWELFHRVVDWCRDEGILPKTIVVHPNHEEETKR